MHYKKFILLGVLVLLSFCIGCVININRVYPNPEKIPCVEGENFDYKGLKITAGELEIYTEEELKKKYGDITEDEIELAGEILERNFIIANVSVKNQSGRQISLGKEGFLQWVIEVGCDTNGVAYDLFLELNPEYKKSFENGDELKLKIPYPMIEKDITLEEIKKNEILIIYSYYPDKRYISYPAIEGGID